MRGEKMRRRVITNDEERKRGFDKERDGESKANEERRNGAAMRKRRRDARIFLRTTMSSGHKSGDA